MDDPLGLRKNYLQRFGTTDTIVLQALNDSSGNVTVKAKNLVSGAQTSFTPTKRQLPDGSYSNVANVAGLSEGLYVVTMSAGGETFTSNEFEVCDDGIDETILIEYTNSSNETFFDNAFQVNGLPVTFYLRLQGGFKPGGYDPRVEVSVFRTQMQELRVLYSQPYARYQLTVGTANGVPVEVVELLNNILSLDTVRIDGVRYVRSEGDVPQKQQSMAASQLFQVTCMLERIIAGDKRNVSYDLAEFLVSSNMATQVQNGQSYSTSISSSDVRYSVDQITVTMGGVDITSTAVAGTSINIPRVTGDITITATASFYASVVIEDTYITVKTGQSTSVRVKLDAHPAANQTVTVSVTGSITAIPALLTFTTSNWDTWQTVSVTTDQVLDTEYANVVFTNSDPLMTESTATIEIQPLAYEDVVDTTIPAGAHVLTSSDFDTTSNYGNYIRLTGYHGTWDNVYVPDTIDGKLTWITSGSGTTAFRNNTTIKYVTFADGVTVRPGGQTTGCSIEQLFEGCTNLIGVSNLPTDATKMNTAFSGCTNFKFADNLDELVNITTINQAFNGCSALEYIQDISGMTGVGGNLQQTFRNCSSLVKVFGFPNPVAASSNMQNAYVNDTNLVSAIVPAGVTNLTYTFGYCSSLRKVEIYDDNLTTSNIGSTTFYNCTNLTVYCNANTTTHTTLLTLFGSSTQITIETFGGGGSLPSIVVWGDSISSPNKAWLEWPERLQNKIGLTDYIIKNEALAGEWSTSTTARQGGYEMTVGAFTIPADGTPTLVTITVNGDEQFGTSPLFSCGGSYNPCSINGVSGVLTRSGSDYYFARNAAGQAVSAPEGTTIISDHDTAFNNSDNVMLFFLNGNAGWYNDPDKMLDMFQKAVDHFTALGGTKYILTGLSNLFADTPVALAEEFDALAASAFGSHYFSLREYQIQNGLSQNGLTPSALDTQRMAEGRVPASLVGGGSVDNILIYDGVNVTDQVHPNAYGANTIMLAFYDKGKALGYWS